MSRYGDIYKQTKREIYEDPPARPSRRWHLFLRLRYHCLISYREGLGTSLYIMGLAAIDPHSLKEHSEIYKIPKFGVNRPNSMQDKAIWKC